MLTLIALTLLLAGTVKGLFGLGLPTITMGLLGLIMPPVQAAALLVVPTLATNALQLAGGPALRTVLSRFGSMILPSCVGTLLESVCSPMTRRSWRQHCWGRPRSVCRARVVGLAMDRAPAARTLALTADRPVHRRHQWRHGCFGHSSGPISGLVGT
jgi:hypothetical protein